LVSIFVKGGRKKVGFVYARIGFWELEGLVGMGRFL